MLRPTSHTGQDHSSKRDKDKKVVVRLTRSAKQILQAAASAMDRSVNEFVLESALARAEAILPDRQRLRLNEAQ